MRRFNIAVNGMSYEVEVEEIAHEIKPASARPRAVVPVPVAPPSVRAVPDVVAAVAGGSTVAAPMPGTILSILVKQGESVKRGQILLMLEAMKMENEIRAGSDGVILTIAVKEGETVNTGQTLITLS